MGLIICRWWLTEGFMGEMFAGGMFTGGCSQGGVFTGGCSQGGVFTGGCSWGDVHGGMFTGGMFTGGGMFVNCDLIIINDLASIIIRGSNIQGLNICGLDFLTAETVNIKPLENIPLFMYVHVYVCVG